MNSLSRMKLNSLIKKSKSLYDKREGGGRVDAKYEIKAYLALAAFYDKHLYDKDLPKAEIKAMECYRAAANLGAANAQYEFARRYVEMGKFWDAMQEDMFAQSIHKTYAQNYYDEAFNYLDEATKNGSFLAKRLHGVVYINGWGVPADHEKGFKLVVDSIEEEGAWDKMTEILTELGLNSPEFFASIMAAKQQKQ